MSKTAHIVSWISQIVAVVIMGQTLFFKFSGHEQTQAIFQQLNMPGGAILIGVIELIACLLLIIPQSIVYGAILGAGVMSGAVIGHITVLGWEGETGYLGSLAILTLIACIVVLAIRREGIPVIGSTFKKRGPMQHTD